MLYFLRPLIALTITGASNPPAKPLIAIRIHAVSDISLLLFKKADGRISIAKTSLNDPIIEVHQ